MEDTLGDPIPPDTLHAVSVSLPKWKDNIGYEEGEERVVSRMQTGYPRFFIHKSIQAFARLIAQKYGSSGQLCMLFASRNAAVRCQDFIRQYAAKDNPPFVCVQDFAPLPKITTEVAARVLDFSAVLYPPDCAALAKSFWQHTGEGFSSRRAEYCHKMFELGGYVERAPRQCRGPRRYRKEDVDSGKPLRDSVLDAPAPTLIDGELPAGDPTRFVEERFGRNLDIELADRAKLAIKRRIAGALADDDASVAANMAALQDQPSSDAHLTGFSPDDVFLYPGGMNAIYSAHRLLLSALDTPRKSICFGFPYIDTLKVLQKFGPGALFYGRGSAADLDDLEARLAAGERYLALFCEFPSNPMLTTPDVARIRALADKYDFAVVIDETVGNFLNVHVLPYADVLVTSLTKIFSGDSNVMGGAAALNPRGRWHSRLRAALDGGFFEDTYWPEDAVFLERNSRDFAARVGRIDANAALICRILDAARPAKVRGVHYPSVAPSRPLYERCRRRGGGYGGLLSATFASAADAQRFYDALDVHKGPSLGTNFTLASPFVILAHYGELEWARGCGVPPELVRFSVGLEPQEELRAVFERALAAV